MVNHMSSGVTGNFAFWEVCLSPLWAWEWEPIMGGLQSDCRAPSRVRRSGIKSP